MVPPAKPSAAMRPSSRLASVTVGCVPPRPYDAGPGSAPALSGPTFIRPSVSTDAIEPPPAPISTISTTGIFTGMPLPFMKRCARSTSKLRESIGSKSSMRQILAVVPPMSKETTRGSARSRAIAAARMAPPAGPDSMSRTGKRAAVSSVTRLPPEVIIRQGAPMPAAARREATLSR
jgi:hypothetical protein